MAASRASRRGVQPVTYQRDQLSGCFEVSLYGHVAANEGFRRAQAQAPTAIAACGGAQIPSARCPPNHEHFADEPGEGMLYAR